MEYGLPDDNRHAFEDELEKEEKAAKKEKSDKEPKNVPIANLFALDNKKEDFR